MLIFVFDFHNVLVSSHKKIYNRGDFIYPDLLENAFVCLLKQGHKLAIASCGNVNIILQATSALSNRFTFFLPEDIFGSIDLLKNKISSRPKHTENKKGKTSIINDKIYLLQKIIQVKRPVVSKQDIRFFDDRHDHIEETKKAGFQSFQITTLSPLISYLYFYMPTPLQKTIKLILKNDKKVNGPII